MTDTRYLICHECDQLVELAPLPVGNRAVCPRCRGTLTINHYNAQNRVIAFSITALIFLALSFLFPFLTFSAQGQDTVSTLMQSITMLVHEDFSSLAIIIFFTIIVVPVLYLLSSIYVYMSLKSTGLFPGTYIGAKLLEHLKHWSMADIFLIGILISFIKITSMADVSLGLSFWAYVLFIISMTAAVLHVDRYQVWQWIREKEYFLSQQKVTDDDVVLSCHVCMDVAPITQKSCATCGTKLHERKKNSIQITWALLITAVLLYLPANMLPIMYTHFLGEETASTILGGVLVLWDHGSYPIAIIIFVASVLVPIGKLIALSWLCYSAQTNNDESFHHKTQVYRITELIGRWSMVDVFVVAVLVALIHQGKIMSVYPGWGALAFAAMVIVSVMAALSFDPRLIWDSFDNNEQLNE